jgi:carbamoyltransferase
MFNVMGVSAFFHDSACCLLQDGSVTAAIQEERLSRRKHDPALPKRAFQMCLDVTGLTIADIDCVAYFERPWIKLERQLWQAWPTLSRTRCGQLWRKSRLPEASLRDVLGYDGEIEYVDHHSSHAASTFHFSGYEEAAVLTVDAVGEWATTTYGHGIRNQVQLFEQVSFPHSLGLFYSTITGYLGFGVNDGEYKVMGLAPYGQPRYVKTLEQCLSSGPRGQFTLDAGCFDFTDQERMYSDKLVELLGHPPRDRGEPLLTFHQDVARSLQVILERVLLEKIRYLHDRVPVDNICLAGGVALNCTANGRILKDGPFKRLFVQPAAGDAGGALGAAALAHVRRTGLPIQGPLEHVYLGPSYTSADVKRLLEDAGVRGETFEDNVPALLERVVDFLTAGAVVAWFWGRMEFGPRALGARSILADPRDAGIRNRINALVKKREGFRPFAPAVLARVAGDHFALDHPSPFMVEICEVRSPFALPAITHVDGSARVQTVDARANGRFAALLERFYSRTGCPLLLNTSFNIGHEPIVCSPADALLSFARSSLDGLVLENTLLTRGDLTTELLEACRGIRDVPVGNERAYSFW